MAKLLRPSNAAKFKRILTGVHTGQGKTRQAYLWAYRSNRYDDGPPIIVFDYQSGRAGAHARAFLQGWRGHLMVDDYVGYVAAKFMLRRASLLEGNACGMAR